MNAHKIAENLCKKAESLGLCHPTEFMISEALDNVISDHDLEIAYELRNGGFEKAADFLKRQRAVDQLEKEEENNC